MSLRNGKVYSSADSNTTDNMTDPLGKDRTRGQTSTTTELARPSPYLLLVYPIIIALGSIFFYISPVTRSHVTTPAAPLAPGILSDQHAQAVPQTLNYFARKSNAFNQYFVKIGWLWTTLAFVALQFLVAYSRKATSTVEGTRMQDRARHLVTSAIRYTLITLSWIVTTQWFFGSSLIDRSFVLTGGHCESRPTDPIHPSGATTDKINQLPTIFSAVACKAAGGHWRGGADISGHVFMLVLSSAFLLYELIHADNHLPHPHISLRAAANISKSTTQEEKEMLGGWESQAEANAKIYARWLVYAVIALDLWMLLMTAIFFHTWLEKVAGLLLAGASLWAVYFLGEFVPAWRQVVG